MFFYDPSYLLFVFLPTLGLTLLTQMWVKSSFRKYSQVRNSSGITGAEAAMGILHEAGIYDVDIEESRGFLSDHYDPRKRVIRLSPENFQGRSIAAVGIAAHEAGHAIQHARKYAPLALRNAAVPMASIGSSFGYVVIFIGVIMSSTPLNSITYIGLGLIFAVVLFQVINLPVEFDASRRALQLLPAMGILTEQENAGARAMLTAAAMTYVAATATAILQLLYWMMRLGLLGGRSSN